MPLCKKIKCIFIHIPKTAGTSIEFSLGMHGDLNFIGLKPYLNQTENIDNFFGGDLQHLTALELKNRIKNYSNYYKFTFVRNPWCRLVSTIIFRGGIENNLDFNISKSDFKNLVDKINWDKPRFRCQLDYIMNNDGNLLVDFIGRFESLHKDFAHIGSTLGLDLRLEHRMKTLHKHYTEYYDNETRGIVAERYEKDIEYFGYKFEI